MGKHVLNHKVHKYDRPFGELYRIQKYNDSATVSDEDKQLIKDVESQLDSMKNVHSTAVEMLAAAQQAIGPEMIQLPAVRKRLAQCFGLDDSKPIPQEPLLAIATALVRTITGLTNDKRVKFARITESGEQKEGGAVAYGAVKGRSEKELKEAGYLLRENKKKILEKNQSTFENLEFDKEDSEEFIQKNKRKWLKNISESKKEYANAIRNDMRLKGKVVQNPFHPDLYMGGIKLDMFTFVRRMQGGEQGLVARTLVHEATHRYAGTEDHAYMRPDGTGPKPDPGGDQRLNSDFTEKPIQPEDWLGNADSYAFFAFGVWNDAKVNSGKV
jgi:hypothetical protein